MEEKWIRDPLSGILFALSFIGFGFYLTLAAVGAISWDTWWAYLLIAIGFPLAIEFPIRCVNPRYRMRGLIFTRMIIGVVVICIGLGGVFSFGYFWIALVFLSVGLLILAFSVKRYLIPRR